MKRHITPILFGILLLPSSFVGVSGSFERLASAGIFPVTSVVAAEGTQVGEVKMQVIPDDSKVYRVWVTAYSSVPEETDDTPLITASGHKVRDGIIAANFLPFGTLVMIPDIFGDKVFTVLDRMHKRKEGFVDVWMPTKEDALKFGIRKTEIIIVPTVLASK